MRVCMCVCLLFLLARRGEEALGSDVRPRQRHHVTSRLALPDALWRNYPEGGCRRDGARRGRGRGGSWKCYVVAARRLSGRVCLCACTCFRVSLALVLEGVATRGSRVCAVVVTEQMNSCESRLTPTTSDSH